jgi:hypothetical protein
MQTIQLQVVKSQNINYNSQAYQLKAWDEFEEILRFCELIFETKRSKWLHVWHEEIYILERSI